jgi:CheY-like chemotaxis protein
VRLEHHRSGDEGQPEPASFERKRRGMQGVRPLCNRRKALLGAYQHVECAIAAYADAKRTHPRLQLSCGCFEQRRNRGDERGRINCRDPDTGRPRWDFQGWRRSDVSGGHGPLDECAHVQTRRRRALGLNPVGELGALTCQFAHSGERLLGLLERAAAVRWIAEALVKHHAQVALGDARGRPEFVSQHMQDLADINGHANVERITAALARGLNFELERPASGNWPDRPMPPKRILLVDDYPDALEIWGLYLRSIGYEVIESDNGLEAVAQAHQHNPDVIILDLELPGITGFEAAVRLRQSPVTRHIPLIAATGYSHLKQLNQAKASGFDAVLVKPCEPAALVSEIERLLEFSGHVPAAGVQSISHNM